jgi:phosphoglycerate dehydrogenase-like enzyme
MKAVLQHRASSGFRNELARVAPEWLQISVVDEADKAGFFGAMQDAEVLLHVLEPVTAEAIARAPKLRLIQKIGVGLNTIDLEAARTRGIAVANMPGTNSQAVAELTLSLMLAALRCIPYLDREIRAGRGWHLPVDTFDRMGEIGGRTVGLIGYGEVPRRLAPALAALGARVVYTSRAPKPDAIADAMTLAELLSTSDIVSLHVPLTTETEKLINEKTIARMKRGSVLVNTARGRLVDEDALIAALRSGRILAAGLDVFFDEPALAQHPLYALDNVVLTPHVAWLTRETLQRSMGVAIENCRRLAQRQRLLHEVIPERQ